LEEVIELLKLKVPTTQRFPQTQAFPVHSMGVQGIPFLVPELVPKGMSWSELLEFVHKNKRTPPAFLLVEKLLLTGVLCRPCGLLQS